MCRLFRMWRVILLSSLSVSVCASGSDAKTNDEPSSDWRLDRALAQHSDSNSLKPKRRSWRNAWQSSSPPDQKPNSLNASCSLSPENATHHNPWGERLSASTAVKASDEKVAVESRIPGAPPEIVKNPSESKSPMQAAQNAINGMMTTLTGIRKRLTTSESQNHNQSATAPVDSGSEDASDSKEMRVECVSSDEEHIERVSGDEHVECVTSDEPVERVSDVNSAFSSSDGESVIEDSMLQKSASGVTIGDGDEQDFVTDDYMIQSGDESDEEYVKNLDYGEETSMSEAAPPIGPVHSLSNDEAPQDFADGAFSFMNDASQNSTMDDDAPPFAMTYDTGNKAIIHKISSDTLHTETTEGTSEATSENDDEDDDDERKTDVYGENQPVDKRKEEDRRIAQHVNDMLNKSDMLRLLEQVSIPVERRTMLSQVRSFLKTLMRLQLSDILVPVTCALLGQDDVASQLAKASSLLSYNSVVNALMPPTDSPIISSVEFPVLNSLSDATALLKQIDSNDYKVICLDALRLQESLLKNLKTFKQQRAAKFKEEDMTDVLTAVICLVCLHDAELELMNRARRMMEDDQTWEKVGYDVAEDEACDIKENHSCCQMVPMPSPGKPLERLPIEYLQGFDRIVGYFLVKYGATEAGPLACRFLHRYMPDFVQVANLLSVLNQNDARALEIMRFHFAESIQLSPDQVDMSLLEALRDAPFSVGAATALYLNKAESWSEMDLLMEFILHQIPETHAHKTLSLLTAANVLFQIHRFQDRFTAALKTEKCEADKLKKGTTLQDALSAMAQSAPDDYKRALFQLQLHCLRSISEGRFPPTQDISEGHFPHTQVYSKDSMPVFLRLAKSLLPHLEHVE